MTIESIKKLVKEKKNENENENKFSLSKWFEKWHRTTVNGRCVLELKERDKELIRRLKEHGIFLKGEHGKYVSFQIIEKLEEEFK